MNIQYDVLLKDLTSIKIGGVAKEYIEINSEKEILELIEYTKDKKIFPLGDGTNTIFKDIDHDIVVCKMMNKGIHLTYDGENFANVEAQAGENWDKLVKWCVDHNLSGLESLSYIPGTVGASPIQNIGAYGVEVSDVISKVKVIEISTSKILELSNDQCEFKYRDSIFKRNPGKYIIISVSFSLSKKVKDLDVPQYTDLQIYFLSKKKVSAKEIRDAVIKIRKSKLPDPSNIPNTGSFFKNPVIDIDTFQELRKEYPNIKCHNTEEGVKMSAGWLIDNCGFKGHSFGKIKVYDNHALVLTNPKCEGNYEDLEKAINQIQASVYEKFGIELEVEPNII